MNSYNFFTTSTNGKFSHYGPLNIDSNLKPHQMVRHSKINYSTIFPKKYILMKKILLKQSSFLRN